MNRAATTLSKPVQITLWQHVKTLTAWLDDAHPRDQHETACRIMKLTEETGEAVAAYLGMTGQNPRKGTCATLDDLSGELCDVAITALVALITVTGDAGSAYLQLEDHVSARFARLAARIAPGSEEWGCECCGDAWFGTPPDDGLCSRCRNHVPRPSP